MLRKHALFLSLAPALLVTGALTLSGALYGLAQSFGYLPLAGGWEFSFQAYRNLFAVREFWVALGFSLWVSAASTLLASAAALSLGLALSRRKAAGDTFILHWNLAFPHLVWAVGLLLALSQSGLLARWAAALGWIDAPAQFPVLVRDRWGLGIILHYVSKETPFLTLVVLAVLRSQAEGYQLVAQNLGASRFQRLRWVVWPQVRPALVSGALLVFAYDFGAYEVPALLGVRYPRVLAALGLEYFLDSDLHRRTEGMAVGVVLALVVLLAALGAQRFNGDEADERGARS